MQGAAQNWSFLVNRIFSYITPKRRSARNLIVEEEPNCLLQLFFSLVLISMSPVFSWKLSYACNEDKKLTKQINYKGVVTFRSIMEKYG